MSDNNVPVDMEFINNFINDKKGYEKQFKKAIEKCTMDGTNNAIIDYELYEKTAAKETAKNINKIKDYERHLLTLDGEEGYATSAKFAEAKSNEEKVKSVANFAMKVLTSAPFVGPFLGSISDTINDIGGKAIDFIAKNIDKIARHMNTDNIKDAFGDKIDDFTSSILEKVTGFISNSINEKKGLTNEQIVNGVLDIVNGQIDEYNKANPEKKINHLPKIGELQKTMEKGLKTAVSQYTFGKKSNILINKNDIDRKYINKNGENISILKNKYVQDNNRLKSIYEEGTKIAKEKENNIETRIMVDKEKVFNHEKKFNKVSKKISATRDLFQEALKKVSSTDEIDKEKIEFENESKQKNLPINIDFIKNFINDKDGYKNDFSKRIKQYEKK